MNEETRRFINEMSRNGELRGNNIRRNNSNNRNTTKKEIYTARKGTAKRAQHNKKRNKIKLKLASILLAAGIGMGGLTAIGRLNKEPEPTISQILSQGISQNELGLANDTIATMRKYDEFFETFDAKNANLSEEEVLNMISEVRKLNFDVIKDKMANLLGLSREDVTLYYDFIRGEDKYYTAVKINDGKEVYNSSRGLLGIGDKDTIPESISNLITQLESYGYLSEDIKSDNVTKAKGIERLEKLYNNISNIATKDFTMDEKGNIGLVDYDSKTKEDRGEER